MDQHSGNLVAFNEGLRNATSLLEKQAFSWFWNVLVECVSDGWGQQKLQKLLKDCVSASDEAFALFLFENSRDMWIAAWRKEKGDDNGVEIPSPLYTTVDTWNAAATLRLEELSKQVLEDRAMEGAEEKEMETLRLLRMK